MKKVLLLLFTLCITLAAKSQIYSYTFVETLSSSSEEVTFTYKVFCPQKKSIDQAGYLAGLRCVIFDGIPGTMFSKPLLSEGEKTSVSKNQSYFDDLYYNRISDFAKDCYMISKFKKSGDNQSTLFQITVKASMLRKDLEKNNIKTRMGI